MDQLHITEMAESRKEGPAVLAAPLVAPPFVCCCASTPTAATAADGMIILVFNLEALVRTGQATVTEELRANHTAEVHVRADSSSTTITRAPQSPWSSVAGDATSVKAVRSTTGTCYPYDITWQSAVFALFSLFDLQLEPPLSKEFMRRRTNGVHARL